MLQTKQAIKNGQSMDDLRPGNYKKLGEKMTLKTVTCANFK